MKSLQPQEWSDLVDRMETNDTLFDVFLEYVIYTLHILYIANAWPALGEISLKAFKIEFFTNQVGHSSHDKLLFS